MRFNHEAVLQTEITWKLLKYYSEESHSSTDNLAALLKLHACKNLPDIFLESTKTDLKLIQAENIWFLRMESRFEEKHKNTTRITNSWCFITEMEVHRPWRMKEKQQNIHRIQINFRWDIILKIDMYVYVSIFPLSPTNLVYLSVPWYKAAGKMRILYFNIQFCNKTG